MAGGEQSKARVAGGFRRQALQAFLPGFEEGANLAHLHRLEQLGQHARHDAAVFQRIGKARRFAGAVGQYAPGAIGAAHQIGGIEMDVPGRGRRLVGFRNSGAQRPQIGVAGINKCRRQMPVFQQLAGAIEIGKHQFQ